MTAVIASIIAFLLGYLFGSYHRGRFDSNQDLMKQFDELEAIRLRQQQVQDAIDEKEKVVQREKEVIQSIMDRLMKHSNLLVIAFAFLASSLSAQTIIPATFSYKDVYTLKPGMVINKLDSVVMVIHRDRYNYYEGLTIDLAQLDASYKVITSRQDSIISLERDGRIACLHDVNSLEKQLEKYAELDERNGRLRNMNVASVGIITLLLGFLLFKK